MMDLIEIVIPMEVAISQVEIPMDVAVSEEEIPMAIDIAYNMVSGDWYEGPYEVTPTQGTQVLLTGGKLMDGNVTVNPIPSNYGLITWNGSVLTVS